MTRKTKPQLPTMRRLTITILILFGNASVVRQSSASNSLWAHVCSMCAAAVVRRLCPRPRWLGHKGSLGIDLAANLLELARTKAAERGLMNTQSRVGELLELRLSDTQFDAAMKHVYEANRSYIEGSGISSIETNVIYAIAQK